MSRKKTGDEKLKKDQLYRLIFEQVNHKSFPARFHVVAVSEGSRLVLRELDNQVVVKSSREAVAQAILNRVQGVLGGELGVTWNEAREAADFWINLQEPVAMPPHFRWQDEIGLSFSVLPWCRESHGPTPTWDTMMARMSNGEPFMAWLGSLFIKEATHQQYVWLYGDGGNGKSAIDRFLARLFGTAYTSEEPPGTGDKFWTSGLIGKRLVVFADCNAKGFPASGKFKALCANDAARIEIKRGDIYSMRLGCRFLFLSNEMPTLSTEVADMRRVIYCALGVPTAAEMRPTFEQELWDQGGFFINKCIFRYMASNLDHGRIAADSEEIQAWASTTESDFDLVFEECFELAPFTVVASNGEAVKDCDKPFATPSAVAKVITSRFPGNKAKQIDFYAYLNRVHKMRKILVRLQDKSREWRYIGLKVKPSLGVFGGGTRGYLSPQDTQ